MPEKSREVNRAEGKIAMFLGLIRIRLVVTAKEKCFDYIEGDQVFVKLISLAVSIITLFKTI